MKPGTSFAANQIAGQIKSINRGNKEITIGQGNKTQELKLSESATVFMNGRLGSLDDLKEGQQVRAAYEDRGGQKNLRWIEVSPGAAPKGTGQNQTGANDTGGSGQAASPSIVGTVVSVNHSTNELVLGHADQKRTLKVASNAPVMINGQPQNASDLKEGDQIRASLDPTKSTVTRIEIISGGTGKSGELPQKESTKQSDTDKGTE